MGTKKNYTFIKFVNQSLKSRLFYLLILIFSSNQLIASPLIDKANESFKYLIVNAAFSNDEKSINIEKTSAAIHDLTLALNHNELTLESEIDLRRVRARSIFGLNAALERKDKPTDNSLSLLAIDDVEFVSKNGDKEFPELKYIVGDLAYNFLGDSVQASGYWSQCAELGHAGCMNIKADLHFTGQNGFPEDLKQSVHWHKRVYETGTTYICAGILSANSLANFSFYLSDSLKNESWKDWREKRDALLNELKESDIDQDCSDSALYFDDYLKDLTTDSTRLGDLERVIRAAEDDDEKEVLNFLNPDMNVTELTQLLARINTEASQCKLSFNVVLYAKHTNQKRAFELSSELFETLDREKCSSEFAFIKRFRNKGKWD